MGFEHEAMMQFLYRIRPTRANMLAEGPTEREAQVVGEHFAYLKALVEAGTVLMAGRTTQVDGTWGIVIFVAPSEPAADALMRDDPAVREGVMTAELFPFRVALWSPRGPDEAGDE
jgi:uncharacterized protein